MKQASRQWNSEFSKFLCTIGYSVSAYDPCLFTKGPGSTFVALLVYVDDVIITVPSLDLLIELKTSLNLASTIKELGTTKFLLGMEITRGSDGTSLNQRKYILEILSSHGLLCCKPIVAPLPLGIALSQGNEEILQEPEMYRRLVGQLLYLSLKRLDISHATQQLSQFVVKPTLLHWHAIVHVLKYLKSCPSLGVFYPSQNAFKFRAYTDANWALARTPVRLLLAFAFHG